MQDSKLWQLITKFDGIMLREAERVAYSPYFNRKEHLQKLWGHLKEILEDGLLFPEPESAFQAAFPGLAFKEQKLRVAMSELYQLLLQYLAHKEMAQEPELNLLYQARALRRLGLDGQARFELQRAQQASERSPFRHAEHYLLAHEIQKEEYRFSNRAAPTEDATLQSLSDSLDLAYMSAKLRQACLMIAHRSVYPSSSEVGFMETAIRYIEAAGLIQEPSVALYYHCYLALRHDGEEARFISFKQLLIQQGGAFPSAEVRDLYLLAINYCIRKVNEGQERYFGEIMELYKEGLKAGHLLDNGRLSRFTYHNIVATALRTRDYDWAERFIHDYRNALSREYRESSFSFCLARLEYTRKRFDEALPLLQKANYRDPLLNLAAKTLLMKIYYESQEMNLLDAHLDAMRNYIRRKRVIGYHRENYLNITRYAQKLSSLNPFDQRAIAQLYEAIRREEVLTEKLWFEEQLELYRK
ncbi:MAG: hypothetical protein H6557_22515 [Lewinellaceae bacterium]|nr:hypothetical protein [Phaeodactylibacter sp.]MCB9039399.1 hypothetical protein [Lewinellaceae bacterium]